MIASNGIRALHTAIIFAHQIGYESKEIKIVEDLYHTLSDVIEIENIDSVRISNINGGFFLSQMQLKKFKREVSTMEFEGNISVKVGSINIELYINNRSFLLSGSTKVLLSGSTKGELVRFSNKYIDYYFKLNGINLNNYKPHNEELFFVS